MQAKVDSCEATFWEHVIELRRTFIAAFAIILIGIATSLFFYQELLNFFILPLSKQTEELAVHPLALKRIENTTGNDIIYRLSHDTSIISSEFPLLGKRERHISIPPGKSITLAHKRKNSNLVLLGPLEGITTTLKVCFWTGIVITSPFWLYLVLSFIAPAFNASRRHLAIGFLAISLVFLFSGFLFAYCITLPLANQYLLAFSSSLGENLWSLQRYIDYTLLLLLANGLAFELSLVLFFLVHIGILTEEMMRSKRRHAIVAAFILAAVLTPPDVLTQILLAIPMLVFYELAILYAKQKPLSWQERAELFPSP